MLRLTSENIIANSCIFEYDYSRVKCESLLWNDVEKVKYLKTKYCCDNKDTVNKFSNEKNKEKVEVEKDLNNSSSGFNIILMSDCIYGTFETTRLLFSTCSKMLADNFDNNRDNNIDNGKNNSNNNNNYNNNNNCEPSSVISSKIYQKSYQDVNYINDDDNVNMVEDEIKQTSTGGAWNEEFFIDNNNNNYYNNSSFSDNKLSNARIENVIVVGYERRKYGNETNINEIFKIAEEFGFEWCIAEDFVVDMFGNRISERSLFWEKCIFLFIRK